MCEPPSHFANALLYPPPFLRQFPDVQDFVTLANYYQYLEIKIEEWPSRAKWGQSGPNGAK